MSSTDDDSDDGRWPVPEQLETPSVPEVDRTIDSGDSSGYDDTPCACPLTALSEDDDTLEIRNPLRDANFYTTSPAGKVRLPLKAQLFCLRKAHNFAPCARWHALRGHWPQVQRQYYSGKNEDSCDEYYDPKAEPRKSEKLLNQYWDQVYAFNIAGQKAVGEQYEASAEKRKLVESFFGIKPAKAGKLPLEGLEGEALDKVEDWHDKVFSYITTARSGKNKPVLSCGSTAMRFQRSFDEWKDEQGKGTKTTTYMALSQSHERYDDYWLWWNENTKEYFAKVRTEWEKEDFGNGPDVTPYRSQDMTKSDPCAGDPGLQGVTFSSWAAHPDANAFQKRIASHRSVVFLCPQSFELNVPTAFPPLSMHNLDRKAHAVGTELINMQSNGLTLYHEMYHLVIESTNIERKISWSKDQHVVGAKENPEGQAYMGFPAEKKWYHVRSSVTMGPIQCMYLALYDRAQPLAQNVDGLLAVKNPESYAWFGLTNALHNIDKMDWSSGKAVAAGSAYKGVWTSNEDHIADPWVPFDTMRGDDEEDCPEQAHASGGYTYVVMADSSDSGNEIMPGDSSSDPGSIETDGEECSE